MSLTDDLVAARALIDTPEKWGRGMTSFVRAYSDKIEGPMCAMGACMWRAHNGGGSSYARIGGALDAALKEMRGGVPDGVPGFNDDPATTHADIMALFQRAIDASKAADND